MYILILLFPIVGLSIKLLYDGTTNEPTDWIYKKRTYIIYCIWVIASSLIWETTKRPTTLYYFLYVTACFMFIIIASSEVFKELRRK